jgi:cytochrome oxidase assembly protein ShyY1
VPHLSQKLYADQCDSAAPQTVFLHAALIPITAFGLGTWQVYRLQWKSKLIAVLEDRLVRDPLPLPPTVDPKAAKDFDHRRVEARGWFRHDQEMLIGPRIHRGINGFNVVTPLEREPGSDKVLINRGWIPKTLQDGRRRLKGLPLGQVTVRGLLREPFKKNMFTPDNNVETGDFHFPDVEQMARLTGSKPIYIEETMGQSLISVYSFRWTRLTHPQSPTSSNHMIVKPKVYQLAGLQRSHIVTIIRSISSHGKRAFEHDESSAPITC